MITEQEFLEAIKVVKSYQLQVNNIVAENIPINKFEYHEKGSEIILTRDSGSSKHFKVGGVFKVIACEFPIPHYDVKNKSGVCFEAFLDTKYPSADSYPYHWWDYKKDTFYETLSALIEWGGEFKQRIKVKVSDGKYYYLRSDLYEYKRSTPNEIF
jgi:hypothetical protein